MMTITENKTLRFIAPSLALCPETVNLLDHIKPTGFYIGHTDIETDAEFNIWKDHIFITYVHTNALANYLLKNNTRCKKLYPISETESMAIIELCPVMEGLIDKFVLGKYSQMYTSRERVQMPLPLIDLQVLNKSDRIKLRLVENLFEEKNYNIGWSLVDEVESLPFIKEEIWRMMSSNNTV